MDTNNPIERSAIAASNSRFPYFLWLVWMMWLPIGFVSAFIALFKERPSALHLTVTLLGVVLFVGIYSWTTLRNTQRLTAMLPSTSVEFPSWLPIASLTIISLVIIFLEREHGNEWFSLFIFTSAYTGGRLSPIKAALVIAALTVLTILVGLLIHLSLFDIGQSAIFVAVVGVVVIGFVRSITTSRELRIAREEIARLAVTAERLRIARDLHDLLGHNLSLITLKSELAGRLVSVAPERAAKEISDVEQVARTTLQEVREAVGNYRQPTLANELHAAQEILAAAGIVYACEEDQSIQGALPPTIEAVLSWTVREGVTNVIRHSRAHHCTIRVTRDAHKAHVEVLDDGTKTSTLSSSPIPVMGGTSNGLRGLMERIAALGGHCEAQAQASGGFRLAVSVPLA